MIRSAFGRSFACAGLLICAASGVLAQAADSIVIPAKFDTSTEHVLIPVSIGGSTFWCNPDTGFSALIAPDRAKAVKAGLRVAPGVSTPDGNPPSPGDSSATANVVVGGVMFADYSIIVRTLPEEAPDMDCIMGLALLRRFVVEFDHITPRLILHERASYRPPSDMTSVPLLFRSNPTVPYVDIELRLSGGAPQLFRVVPDTGAAFYGAVFVGDAMTRVRSQLPSVSAITYSDSRITQLIAARPASISVGPFTMQKPVIALLEGTVGGGGIADGVLGSGFLRRFTAAFDFEGRRMYLKPNERLSGPHLFDASGIGLIRHGDRTVVYDVLADSPGSAAGVRKGDVLLEIDGGTASALTPVELRSLLNVDGATRRLGLEREGQRLVIEVRLKARL